MGSVLFWSKIKRSSRVNAAEAPEKIEWWEREKIIKRKLASHFEFLGDAARSGVNSAAGAKLLAIQLAE